MLNYLQKSILELNYLGCSIAEKDKFKPFEKCWRTTVEEIKQPSSYNLQLDLNKIISLLTQSILKQTEGKEPVVLLSGGVDSTLIAAILSKEKKDFRCFSYALGKDDPTLENVRYVEQKLGIKSEIIYYDRARVTHIWDNYFNYYSSPTMDYATLVMADLITQAQSSLGKDTVLLDGIGADDLFGCSGLNKKNLYRAYSLRALSQLPLKRYRSYHRRWNIYTLAVIRNLFAITLYQNYIFSRVLVSGSLKKATNYINEILLQLDSSIHNFYVGHSLMNLFYDGRRVAYKDSGLITNTLEIAYPYLDDKVVDYGISIANELKVSPNIKQPLKSALLCLGFHEDFVYRSKLGFIFNVFDIIDIDSIIEYMTFLDSHFQLSPDY